jgi:hypothetical protein
MEGAEPMSFLFWVSMVLSVMLLAAGVWFIGQPIAAARRRRRFEEARDLFRCQREQLEAKFFDLAGNSGKPRGLHWLDTEFGDAVSYARDRNNGRLSAFVAITIRFEAIEGGDMEEVEAVGNLKAATAVFHFIPREMRWVTEGRSIFNLNPFEAIRHFRSDLDRVG